MELTMFGLGTTELLIIGGIVVLMFGAKRIPELAKGLGQGIKSFKKEMSTDGEDAEKKKKLDEKKD